MSAITIQKVGEDAATRSLQVTIPADHVAATVERVVRRYAKQVRVPGFRKGKVPEPVVRKRFGPEIREAALQEILRDGWEEAKTTENLKPIADPSIRNLKYEDGAPVEFELLVEVQPQIVLERIGGFTVNRTLVAVTEDQVQEQVDKLRERQGNWIPVEGEKPGPGHLVRIEVAPIEDGVAREAKPYSVVLGAGQTIPDLEERVMGLLPGESSEGEVRFPEDHADPSRRGQLRRVRVTLHDVKRQELPPADDAFAKEAGGFDSIDALRAAIREDLEQEAIRDADGAVRASLIAQIASANQVTAPPTMVTRVLRAFAEAYRIPDDQLETFAQQFHPVAADRVIRDLVLGAVVEQQGLRATEAEVDDRVAQIAERRGVPAGQVYTSLQQAGRLAELEHAITEDKAFAFLLSQSTVTEVAS